MHVPAFMPYSLNLTFNFQREAVCMKPAEGFWQAESHAPCVWSIFFPCVTGGRRVVDLSGWQQNSRGSQAIVYPWVLCRLSPQFQWAPRWAHSAVSNTGQSFEVKNMTPSIDWMVFFFFFLAPQLAGCVAGKVKIIILRRWICSIILIPQTRAGKLICSCPPEKLPFWFLLYNNISPHLPSLLDACGSLFPRRSSVLLSHATVCAHIRGGAIMNLLDE